MTLDLKLLSCPRQVDVLIQILEGDSTQITFQGVGYNPNDVEEAATSRQFFSSAVIPGSARLTVPGQVSPSVGYEHYDQSRNVWETEIYKWPHLAVVCVAGEFICHETEQDISLPAGDLEPNSWMLKGIFFPACHFHSH